MASREAKHGVAASRRAVLVGGFASAFAMRAAHAEAWPSRPVRIMVPFAAGSPLDLPARAIADQLTEAVGRPVIVENRGGAGGAVGTQAVVAANDPHFMMLTTGAVAIHPALVRNPIFDPFQDLKPITLVLDSSLVLVLVVRQESPFSDLAALLSFAKTNPGRVSYGTSGVGATTHLASALFAHRAGIELLHVPFRGSSPATAALLAGDIDMMITSTNEGMQHISGGRVRALGVTSTAPLPMLPGVPPVVSLVPGYEASIWYAMLGPRAMPDAVVDRLITGMAPLRRGSQLQERLAAIGATLRLDGPGPLAERLRQEVPQWRELGQASGLVLD
ncbi:MAG: tripartite tricarboxylate transporter substrate binding protein [Roseomonas sp.]|nr:tripartite tricarboxylate transporter substrate binding protein [Roseomonas sp.]